MHKTVPMDVSCLLHSSNNVTMLIKPAEYWISSRRKKKSIVSTMARIAQPLKIEVTRRMFTAKVIAFA